MEKSVEYLQLKEQIIETLFYMNNFVSEGNIPKIQQSRNHLNKLVDRSIQLFKNDKRITKSYYRNSN